MLRVRSLYGLILYRKSQACQRRPQGRLSNSQFKIFTKKAGIKSEKKLNALAGSFYLILVYKPSHFPKNSPTSAVKRHRTDDRRVRAGVSIKGQAKGLTFYADRPRTSVSLSIAQRGFDGQFFVNENCWIYPAFGSAP
jgi:hypothetical protein